jgi:4-carboxymuconolactone decarboxylase
MVTLEERFQASQPVLARLGRVDADGVPVPSATHVDISPDQWRIIREACFGTLWSRPALAIEQRSLATISVITVMRRDDNLKGHLHSGLDVGFSAAQIVEALLQLIFYVGAPIANTALELAYVVFKERGIQVHPYRVYDPAADPEVLYRRGLATRRQVLGDDPDGEFDAGHEVDRAWERYLLEYLWGSIWTRPGLDLASRCLCTLTAQTVLGTDQAIATYARAARRLGLAEASIEELFFHLSFYVGDSLARRGAVIARQALQSR